MIHGLLWYTPYGCPFGIHDEAVEKRRYPLDKPRARGNIFGIFGQKTGKRQTFEEMVNGEPSLTLTKYICQKDAAV